MYKMEAVSRRAGGKNCFYVFRRGEEDGPFSLDELEELHRQGEVPAATPCRSRRDQEWHDLGFVLRSSLEQEEAEKEKAAPDLERTVAVMGVEERGTPTSASPIRVGEGGWDSQLSELIGVTRQQNRLLSSILGILVCAILVVLGGGVLLWLGR